MDEPKETPVYKHSMPVQIRFNDVDQYGHVNNNAYFAYYDLGKQDYLMHVLRVNYRTSEVVPVIANINADFIIPIFHGDDIVVETRTWGTKVSRSSSAPSTAPRGSRCAAAPR